ncbi:3-deoxy-D-manno-octulosonate 8-phosphate phosphatase (KDO 8-P phosphatase) [Hydrogenivirga caldilitoris]|uniref:3-deoxy-D-manno-octulosonate 8-phosphate phosphatase (KDO 8-P phosphatase) n=1 Tax=Hydrogenivirga caldilitoris TaxID=246264 RepID=A0A497XM99_9AQUI|nr:HAD-IIIA family hydrolase [Hydrogenivirga caldilitoris]RLJ69928.1 3-deoxy-D-manno-octulosonate 8-phosphate phosphatase (KDO 8-P phosphatase) [Hydrogenivirga caldilitoris]
MSLRQKVRKLKLLLMDVDGVLTDGRLFYTEGGERIKVFNVHDGLGIKLLQRAGIMTGVISGRESEALRNRLSELGIEEVFMGRTEKDRVLNYIMEKHGLSTEEVGFVGDDLVDIPVMRRVVFPVAVKNAPPVVKENAVYVTNAEGGKGAVREVCDLILKLTGKDRALMKKYT